MWTQIVGKVRLALCPRVNHWWEVPLYVSARGLNTSPIPYQGRVFEVEFDFIDHQLDDHYLRERCGYHCIGAADAWRISMPNLWRRCVLSISM